MWKLNKQPRAATPAEVAKQRLGLKPVQKAQPKTQELQDRARVWCAKAMALVTPRRKATVQAREHPSVAAGKFGPKVTVSLARRRRKMALSK